MMVRAGGLAPVVFALAVGLAGGLAPLGAGAASLGLPNGAQLKAEEVEAAGRYAMPVGPWSEAAGVDVLAIEGKITRQAWRIGGTGLSSFQLMLNLRQQLVKEGFEVLFQCGTEACGGFDFRYGTEVLGEPMMHVDLGDYQFLSAKKPGAVEEYASLLVSRSASAGFVQIIQVGEMAAVRVEPALSTKAEPGAALPGVVVSDIGVAMEKVGRFVMTDLVFATGSSELTPGQFGSLTDLADYLKAHPEKRVALVGHTDATGALSGNVALSKRRATAVMDRLVREHGVAPGQLEAEGVGYLSPLASNQTDDGRQLNRRVEAILVSTK